MERPEGFACPERSRREPPALCFPPQADSIQLSYGRHVFFFLFMPLLVAAINYRHRIVFIKWIGTHADYDEIDVKTVRYGHQTD